MILKKVYKILKKRIENYYDTSKKHFFNVQIAKTDKEKEIGLMNIKSMPLDSGMLFEYKDNSMPSMWMKQTLIPLDAIFINKNAKVVHIEHDMQPGSLESRKTSKRCKYVLEINGGLSKKMEIKEGDLIGTKMLSKNLTNFKVKETSNKGKKTNSNKGKNSNSNKGKKTNSNKGKKKKDTNK
tara:strand:+ start:160 stop:705 length:546 start_codon:yes stop_codon:yes gene_type:complete